MVSETRNDRYPLMCALALLLVPSELRLDAKDRGRKPGSTVGLV